MDRTQAHREKDVRICVANIGDAPQIAACLEEAFAPFRALYAPEAYADTVPSIDGLSLRIASMRVLVAVADDQVVGTIAGAVNERGEGHLRGMAVLPQWQGSGIATQLLTAIENDLRAQRCLRVTLDTTSPLERAIRFYQSHGYRRTGVIGDFYGMPLYEFAKDL
jgi:ribosomal protein S18 acetylase RimI-like enzyme